MKIRELAMEDIATVLVGVFAKHCKKSLNKNGDKALDSFIKMNYVRRRKFVDNMLQEFKNDLKIETIL